MKCAQHAAHYPKSKRWDYSDILAAHTLTIFISHLAAYYPIHTCSTLEPCSAPSIYSYPGTLHHSTLIHAPSHWCTYLPLHILMLLVPLNHKTSLHHDATLYSLHLATHIFIQRNLIHTPPWSILSHSTLINTITLHLDQHTCIRTLIYTITFTLQPHIDPHHTHT